MHHKTLPAPKPRPRHEAVATTKAGPMGAPVFAYRGATILSATGGTQFRIVMPGAPFDGWGGRGRREQIMRIVDSWKDHGRWPAPYRAREGTP